MKRLKYDEGSPRTRIQIRKDKVCKNKHLFKKGSYVYKYVPNGGLHCPFCGERLK
jgi:hypothetical protein